MPSSAGAGTGIAGTVPVVLLPGLAYTKSDEHHHFPGTIWLSWDTLMRTLVDIGRSLQTCGITRLLFVNGHGGNSALGQVACREIRRRFGLRLCGFRVGLRQVLDPAQLRARIDAELAPHANRVRLALTE